MADRVGTSPGTGDVVREGSQERSGARTLGKQPGSGVEESVCGLVGRRGPLKGRLHDGSSEAGAGQQEPLRV